MEVPVGKCSACGRTIHMWRCGDTPGGGTYHIVCFECSGKDSQQSIPFTAFWRWAGWMVVTGFVMLLLFVVLVFGGF